MTVSSNAFLQQHRLLALGTAGVLVMATATAVTWRVPTSMFARAGVRSAVEQVLDGLSDLGGAASEAITLGQAAGGGFAGGASARPIGFTTHGGPLGGLNPLGMDSTLGATSGTGATPAGAGSLAADGDTDDDRPSADDGGGGLDASDGDDAGTLPDEVTAALTTLLAMVVDLGGTVPDVATAVDDLTADVAGVLATIADATAETGAAPASGALAEAGGQLHNAVQGLLGTLTAIAPTPAGDVDDSVLRAAAARVSHHIGILNRAVEQHTSSLESLTGVAVPALPSPTLPPLPDAPGTTAPDGGADEGSTIPSPASVSEAKDAFTNAVAATITARLTEATDAATAAGAETQSQAAALAWEAQAAVEIAVAVLGALAQDDGGDDVATLTDAAQGITAPAESAAAALGAAVTAAADTLGDVAGVPGLLAQQLCATVSCSAPVLPTAGDDNDAPDAEGQQPGDETPDAPAAPDLTTLYDAADLDDDGDVDEQDLDVASSAVALAVGTIIDVADVDGDGDVDADDAAALVALTPVAALSDVVEAQVLQLASQLAAELTALGDQAASAASENEAALQAAVAAFRDGTDADGDGNPDQTGVIRTYNALTDDIGGSDPDGLVTAVTRAATDALDRNGDGTIGISDTGCVSPAVGTYRQGTEDDLEDALTAPGAIEPASLNGLTLVQLAVRCASQDADGAPASPAPDAAADLSSALASIVGSLTPGCDPATTCTATLTGVLAGLTDDAQQMLDDAAIALFDVLDIDGDGGLDDADADPFGDAGLQSAFVAMTGAVAAVTDIADRADEGTEADAFVAALSDTLITTTGDLAAAALLTEVTSSLLAVFDHDADGELTAADAAAAGAGLLVALPGGGEPPTPSPAPAQPPPPLPQPIVVEDPPSGVGAPSVDEAPTPPNSDPGIPALPAVPTIPVTPPTAPTDGLVEDVVEVAEGVVTDVTETVVGGTPVEAVVEDVTETLGDVLGRVGGAGDGLLP